MCTVHFTVCYYHVTHAFQSESILYSSLNVKKLLARNWRGIWSLSDSNRIRTHNQLVRKRTLNHLAKLAKWLCCVASTYLHSAFDFIIIMSCTRFRLNLHYSYLNVKEFFGRNICDIWSLNVDSIWNAYMTW